MITLTLTHVYIALGVIAGLVGWVLAYYEYTTRVKVTQESKDSVAKLIESQTRDKKAITESCNSSLTTLETAHKNELQKLEEEQAEQLKELADLHTVKLKEVDDKYSKILNQQEAEISIYESYMVNISNLIKVSRETINTIDSRGTFQSDDELGDFFDTLKQIQAELNKFKVEIKETQETKDDTQEVDF